MVTTAVDSWKNHCGSSTRGGQLLPPHNQIPWALESAQLLPNRAFEVKGAFKPNSIEMDWLVKHNGQNDTSDGQYNFVDCHLIAAKMK